MLKKKHAYFTQKPNTFHFHCAIRNGLHTTKISLKVWAQTGGFEQDYQYYKMLGFSWYSEYTFNIIYFTLMLSAGLRDHLQKRAFMQNINIIAENKKIKSTRT